MAYHPEHFSDENKPQDLAEDIANRVIAVIGDQLKLPGSMAEWLKQQYIANGNSQWFWDYPVGYGSYASRMRIVCDETTAELILFDPMNRRIWEVTLHT